MNIYISWYIILIQLTLFIIHCIFVCEFCILIYSKYGCFVTVIVSKCWIDCGSVCSYGTVSYRTSINVCLFVLMQLTSSVAVGIYTGCLLYVTYPVTHYIFLPGLFVSFMIVPKRKIIIILTINSHNLMFILNYLLFSPWNHFVRMALKCVWNSVDCSPLVNGSAKLWFESIFRMLTIPVLKFSLPK